eukprot:scaffold127393_cov63-Phaeocystis_antarctica.AAC.2
MLRRADHLALVDDELLARGVGQQLEQLHGVLLGRVARVGERAEGAERVEQRAAEHGRPRLAHRCRAVRQLPGGRRAAAAPRLGPAAARRHRRRVVAVVVVAVVLAVVLAAAATVVLAVVLAVVAVVSGVVAVVVLVVRVPRAVLGVARLTLAGHQRLGVQRHAAAEQLQLRRDADWLE